MASTIYYPEMNEKARGAMFHLQTCLSKMSVKWRPEDNDAALATFRRLRIRPTAVKRWTGIGGREWCSALITYAASEKLEAAADCETEMLLD